MKVERISLVCSVMLAPCVSWIVFVKSALVVISHPALELESLHSQDVMELVRCLQLGEGEEVTLTHDDYVIVSH